MNAVHSALQRFSPRERMLGGVALVLIIVLGLVYGAMLPGISAARSAAARNAEAARELSTIRALAGSVTRIKAGPVDAETLRQSAEASGLVVVDQRADDGGLRMSVSAPGPRQILIWLAEASTATAVVGFVISPAAAGGAAGDVSFAGAGP
jgi:type II secretory pathway component PulM